MRVLMIAPTPFFADRGCHVRIYEEAQALQQLGHKITILTYHIGSNPKNLTIARIPPILFWYKKLEAGPSWWKPILDIILIFKAITLLSRQKFDIIHAHLHEGALIAIILKSTLKLKLPVLFDYQGSLSDEIASHQFIQRNTSLHRLANKLEKFIERNSDYIICNSSSNRSNLLKTSHITPHKIEVINDAVGNKPQLANNQQINKLKKKLKIPQKSFIIVYLGILSKYQGIELLLKSAKEVIQKVPNAHYIIMGYPNSKRYIKKAKKLAIDNRVTFTGRVSYFESWNYLSMGNIAVSPKISKTEANGKLYQYAALGLPIVAFDSKVNREILGNLGIYVKFGSWKDFSQKTIDIFNNPKQQKSLSLALKKKFNINQSWKSSAKKLEKIYNHLI